MEIFSLGFKTPALTPAISKRVEKPGSIDCGKLLESALYVKFGIYFGNAVAISPRLALSSMHNKAAESSSVTLTNIHGVTFIGQVAKVCYAENLVDICLLELEEGQSDFADFTRVSFERIALCDKLLAVGLEATSHGYTSEAILKCSVQSIHKATGSAMFRSSYYSFDGFSGAAILTKRLRNGEYRVVGVHVGTHNQTVKTSLMGHERSNTTSVLANEINLALASIDSNVHGHSSYCLVCEVARVDELCHELNVVHNYSK